MSEIREAFEAWLDAPSDDRETNAALAEAFVEAIREALDIALDDDA